MTKTERKKWDEMFADVAMDMAKEKKRELKEHEVKQAEDKATWLWMRWKCQTDLYFLGSEILGLAKARDKITKRKRLDPRVHKEMAKSLQSDDDELLLYPRLHLKTSWVKYRIVQLVAIDPDNRIGLWSKATGLVKKQLGAIKRLCLNPILMELFPEIFLSRKEWEKDTAVELTICRPKDSERDPQENQVEIWGIESTVAGHHYDFHFYDDVIDEKMVTTVDQIAKVETWWEHVQAIREMSAVEKMTGTRYHQADIYGKIIREHYFPKVTVKEDIYNGKPYYKFFTLKYLAKLRKRMGEHTYFCQMKNKPVPPSDRLFTGPYPIWRDLPEKRKYYIALDPSLGKKWSNKSGLVVGCVDKKRPKEVYYVEALGVKLPPNRLAALLVAKIVQYRPQRVGIEYGQMMALQYLLDLQIKEWESANRQRIRPDFIAISTKQNKNRKIDGTIAAFIRDGRAFFTEKMTDLFAEMDYFNPHSESNDDDILDAAAMLIQTVEHFSQGQWNNVINRAEGPNWTLESLFEKSNKSAWAAKMVSSF